MKPAIIEILQKSNTRWRAKNTNAKTDCCGGVPTTIADACFKLDEAKKAAGENGCNCNIGESGGDLNCCGRNKHI